MRRKLLSSIRECCLIVVQSYWFCNCNRLDDEELVVEKSRSGPGRISLHTDDKLDGNNLMARRKITHLHGVVRLD